MLSQEESIFLPGQISRRLSYADTYIATTLKATNKNTTKNTRIQNGYDQYYYFKQQVFKKLYFIHSGQNEQYLILDNCIKFKCKTLSGVKFTLLYMHCHLNAQELDNAN